VAEVEEEDIGGGGTKAAGRKQYAKMQSGLGVLWLRRFECGAEKLKKDMRVNFKKR
jgi:hypothetical protein